MYAVQQEVLYLYQDTGATVMFKTNFKTSDMPTYKFPLVLIDMEPGGDFQEMPGGLTMADWEFSLSIYDYLQDISGLDPTEFSVQVGKKADDLRRHFQNFTIFKTPEMLAALTNYGTRWTLSGVKPADHIETQDGLSVGFKFIFDTISWDNKTLGVVPGPALQTADINQINNPPFD